MTQYRSKQILSRSSRLFKSVDIRCSNQFQGDPTVYEVGKVTDSTNNHIDKSATTYILCSQLQHQCESINMAYCPDVLMDRLPVHW